MDGHHTHKSDQLQFDLVGGLTAAETADETDARRIEKPTTRRKTVRPPTDEQGSLDLPPGARRRRRGRRQIQASQLRREAGPAIPADGQNGIGQNGIAGDAAVYRAVLALRFAGHLVYRAGASHLVGGRYLNDDQLLAFCRMVPGGSRVEVPTDPFQERGKR